MIQDAALYFGECDFGAGASGATTYGANIIDLTGGNAGKDAFGNSEGDTLQIQNLSFYGVVTETAAGGTSTVLQIVTGSTLSSSHIASALVIAETNMLTAALAKGARVEFSLPIQSNAVGRYLELVSVSTGDFSAGIIEGSVQLGSGDSTIAQRFQG